MMREAGRGFRLPLGEVSFDFREPCIYALDRASICERKRSDHTRFACCDHEIRSGNREHRGCDQWEPKPLRDFLRETIRQHRSRFLAQNMNDANGADADHMSKSCLRVGLLAYARFAAQLARDLGNLSGAGRTDRMAHRE